MPNETAAPQVAIIMGSQTDWPVMRGASVVLDRLGVTHETKIVSAHRTVSRMIGFAQEARARGIKVIIAGAGGSAHLPGMTASETILPVLGVPVPSKTNEMNTLAAVYSMLQMPEGIPLATMPVGNPIDKPVDGKSYPERLSSGAANAGYLAAQIVALSDPALAERILAFRKQLTESVPLIIEDPQ